MVIEADQANVAHGGDGGDLTAGAAQLEVGGQDRGRPDGSAREQQLHPRHDHIYINKKKSGRSTTTTTRDPDGRCSTKGGTAQRSSGISTYHGNQATQSKFGSSHMGAARPDREMGS